MIVYAINLYHGPTDDHYCGCWHVSCPDGDPIIKRLDRANVGRFRDEDGEPARAFFFADELEEQLAAAERATECRAVESEQRTSLRGWIPA